MRHAKPQAELATAIAVTALQWSGRREAAFLCIHNDDKRGKQ
jgi:hypothetical protein